MHGVIKTISISKKKEVLEPSKYYTEVGEKIVKLQFKKNVSFKHYDKKNCLLAEIKSKPDLSNKTVIKTLTNSKFKKLFTEMSLSYKQKKISSNTLKDLKFIKNFYKLPPIIIGGCGRSGTTLLLSILSSHSKIDGIPDETYAFFPKPFRLKKIIYNLKFKKKKLCWLEKTPKNVMVFREIYKLFNGKVRLINIVRNGKSVIQSRHPNSKKKYYVDISRWKNEVKMGYKTKQLTHTVIFDKLIQNPNYELRKICNFLELKFEKRLLNFEKFTTVKKNIAWGDKDVKSIGYLKKNKYKTIKKSILTKFDKDKEAVKLNKYYGF